MTGCSTTAPVAAGKLSDDPRQAFLITLKLLAEVMADLPNGHPGCRWRPSPIRNACSPRGARPHPPRCEDGTRASAHIFNGSPQSNPRRRRRHRRCRRHVLLRRRWGHHHVKDAERSAPAGTADPDLSQLRKADLRGAVAFPTRAPLPTIPSRRQTQRVGHHAEHLGVVHRSPHAFAAGPGRGQDDVLAGMHAGAASSPAGCRAAASRRDALYFSLASKVPGSRPSPSARSGRRASGGRSRSGPAGSPRRSQACG